jgi:hypothetical protein
MIVPNCNQAIKTGRVFNKEKAERQCVAGLL